MSRPWYHGTSDTEFTEFDPLRSGRSHGGGSAAGVFFTDSKDQAHNFRRLALKYGGEPRDKNDGRVIEAIIEGRYKTVDVPELERARARARGRSDGEATPWRLGRQKEWMLRETASARREGYDGVDFVNILDDPLSSKNRATHRVVFPDRVADKVRITASHTLPPSGILEETIAAAKEATRQTKANTAARRAKARSSPNRWRY